MSLSINKVTIGGHVGADPKAANSKTIMTSLSIATSYKYTDKNTGEKLQNTEWHRVIFFNKLAEIVLKYVTKGMPLIIFGRLQNRKYTDKNGIERYITEIIADEMQMVGSRKKDSGQSNQPQLDGIPVSNTGDEDIPF